MPNLTVVFTGSPTERYHPDSGGIQLAELSFCENASRGSWNNKVIYRESSEENIRSVNSKQLPIITENLKLGGLADMIPFSLKASAVVDELCEKGEDCVHFVSLIPAMVYFDHPINEYLRKKRKVISSKFFYTIHNYHYGVSDRPEDIFVDYPEEWKYLYDAELRVVKSVDKTFVTCKRYVNELSTKFDSQIAYLPNTVGDISKYEVASNNDSKYKILLTLSRLETVKNLERLILAVKKVKAHDEDVRLIIGGEGSLLSDLTELCKREGLRCCEKVDHFEKDKLGKDLDSYDVLFVGKIEGESKHFLFESCDCVALFSLREICPLFGLEAMAYGKRILASKIPGWQDYQDFGADVLLGDPYNVDEMANTIIHGMTDIKENLHLISVKSKNVYKKYYSPEVVSAIRYNLYEDCLRSNL